MDNNKRKIFDVNGSQKWSREDYSEWGTINRSDWEAMAWDPPSQMDDATAVSNKGPFIGSGAPSAFRLSAEPRPPQVCSNPNCENKYYAHRNAMCALQGPDFKSLVVQPNPSLEMAKSKVNEKSAEVGIQFRLDAADADPQQKNKGTGGEQRLYCFLCAGEMLHNSKWW